MWLVTHPVESPLWCVGSVLGRERCIGILRRDLGYRITHFHFSCPGSMLICVSNSATSLGIFHWETNACHVKDTQTHLTLPYLCWLHPWKLPRGQLKGLFGSTTGENVTAWCSSSFLDGSCELGITQSSGEDNAAACSHEQLAARCARGERWHCAATACVLRGCWQSDSMAHSALNAQSTHPVPPLSRIEILWWERCN